MQRKSGSFGPINPRAARTNISGGGVAKNSPNKANAIAFLEYLSSPSAQTYVANGNNEWPAVKGAAAGNA
ncbi:MAG: extracellular solute-binding protein [Burkholderiaceae bacterium]